MRCARRRQRRKCGTDGRLRGGGAAASCASWRAVARTGAGAAGGRGTGAWLESSRRRKVAAAEVPKWSSAASSRADSIPTAPTRFADASARATACPAPFTVRAPALLRPVSSDGGRCGILRPMPSIASVRGGGEDQRRDPFRSAFRANSNTNSLLQTRLTQECGVDAAKLAAQDTYRRRQGYGDMSSDQVIRLLNLSGKT